MTIALVLHSNPLLAQATQPAQTTERRRVAQWSQQILVGQYDQHGTRNPAWDESARAALSAYAARVADDHHGSGDELDAMFFSCRSAFQAGCKDPLVRLVAARASYLFERRRDEWLAMHVEAAHRLLQSEYHPLWKCSAAFWCAEYEGLAKKDAAAQADAKRMLEAGLELLPQVLLDESIPRGERIDLFRMMGNAARVVEGTREPACARVFAAVDPQMKDRSLALSLMTRFYIDHAWDARGRGFADSVPDEAWKLLHDRLQVAAKAGSEAWNLDNSNARAAQLMMRVMLGLGDLEQEGIWFRRAARAEPDDFITYRDHLQALEPKWGGSPEAMIAFGRECLNTGDWDAGIPFILVEAHLALAQYAPDGYKSEPQPQYFRQDPQAWQDVKAVYDEYLKRPNPSMYHRSRFAEIALWSGKYQEAAEQFEAMGSKFSYGWFRNDARYHRARAEVAANVK